MFRGRAHKRKHNKHGESGEYMGDQPNSGYMGSQPNSGYMGNQPQQQQQQSSNQYYGQQPQTEKSETQSSNYMGTQPNTQTQSQPIQKVEEPSPSNESSKSGYMGNQPEEQQQTQPIVTTQPTQVQQQPIQPSAPIQTIPTQVQQPYPTQQIQQPMQQQQYQTYPTYPTYPTQQPMQSMNTTNTMQQQMQQPIQQVQQPIEQQQQQQYQTYPTYPTQQQMQSENTTNTMQQQPIQPTQPTQPTQPSSVYPTLNSNLTSVPTTNTNPTSTVILGTSTNYVPTTTEQKIDSYPTSNVHSLPMQYAQPKPDPKPSLHSSSVYDKSAAMEDAKTLKNAIKKGNLDTIADISGRRLHWQRLLIKQCYKAIDESGKPSQLVKELRAVSSGEFQKLLVLLYKDKGFWDAKWLNETMEGMGYNSEILIEILCTRTNQELIEAKLQWTNTGSKGTLKSRVEEKTKKTFSKHSCFQDLLLKLLEAKRPLGQNPIETAVKADAEFLNRMVNQSKAEDAKEAFIKVFTERSFVHLSAVAGSFQSVSKQYTMDTAIRKAFGDSDTSKSLIAITQFVTQPYDYWAQKLLKAMKGLGTDDFALRRVVIPRCEIDLFSVSEVFAQRYGNGKTLKHWLESETSGPYRKLLLLLCGY